MTKKTSTFTLPSAFRDMGMAKRGLYGAYRRPFDLIELFTTADRRRAGLPHQGTKECARSAAKVAA
ncbi:hypothetical protein EOA79_02500 [Mesorhizobium sp. M1A.F.Ca.IN.020.03.2.1]|uniref:hypothetical protein n=1 Tax=Mesorhizobium sp. M1A.F.Ca.IN.020.03.2.1 TaxID=2496769 RepID=UPI000FD32982|nr:hypothetical protein [Mesorhizobium sp. M1A.F.Ca.IN.020.03.2.1]RUV07978.1 hypothetical protein EOA79_02500 [Mesorhizobium sp. M1A.F.Ca.IN.020.03.2.1]